MTDTRPRPRILVIDDDRALTSTLAPLLRDLADCDTAHTAADALAALASHAYQGCVLDLVLGDDASALHDALSTRELPTLLISGRDPDALSRVAGARGWSYAAKPLAPDVLRRLVADLLDVEAPEPTQRGSRPVPAKAVEEPAKASASAQPVAVQLLDKLGDIVGMVAVAYLCAAGKLSGELAVAVIAGIAGVGTTARAITGRSVGVATGAVALAALITASTAAHQTRTERPHAPPPPAIVAALVLALSLAVAGCASMPDAPGASISKVRAWWTSICSSGDQALSLAERTVTALPRDDAGPGDASPRAPRDASVSAESGGGDL